MNSFTQISHDEFSTAPMRTRKLFLCYKTLESEFPSLHIESHFIKIRITTKKIKTEYNKEYFLCIGYNMHIT